MMFGFIQLVRLLPKQYAFRHASSITSKTAQGSIGVAESVFVMGFIFSLFLVQLGGSCPTRVTCKENSNEELQKWSINGVLSLKH